jgi:hypothetical protein
MRSIRHHHAPSVSPSRYVPRPSCGQPPLWIALAFSAAFGAATVAAVFAREPIHAIAVLAGMTIVAFATGFDRPSIVETLGEILKSRLHG